MRSLPRVCTLVLFIFVLSTYACNIHPEFHFYEPIHVCILYSPGYISCHPVELRAGGGTEAHAEEREAPLVQAEVLVQVLVEFWLNQNKYNGRHGDILAQAQVSIGTLMCVCVRVCVCAMQSLTVRLRADNGLVYQTSWLCILCYVHTYQWQYPIFLGLARRK